MREKSGPVVILGQVCEVEYTAAGGLCIRGLGFLDAVAVIHVLIGGAEAEVTGAVPPVQLTRDEVATLAAGKSVTKEAVPKPAKAAKPAAPEPKPALEPEPSPATPAATPPAAKEPEDNASSPAPVRSLVQTRAADDTKTWLIDLDAVPAEILDAKNMRTVVQYFVETLKTSDAQVIYDEFVRMGASGKLDYFTRIKSPREKINDALLLLDI